MSDLTSAERAALAELAVLFIPRSGRMPSGADADAHGQYLDAALRVRPDLAQTVHDVLAAAKGQPTVDPRAPGTLRPVAEALTAAYFLNPDVARAVGYRTRSAIPIRFDDDLAALTTRVTARGPIYRPTPSLQTDPSPQPDKEL